MSRRTYLAFDEYGKPYIAMAECHNIHIEKDIDVVQLFLKENELFGECEAWAAWHSRRRR